MNINKLKEYHHNNTLIIFIMITIIVNIKYLKKYITNFQYHEISIESVQKIIKNMFVQNSWISKCKNGMKNIYYFYINDVSFSPMMFCCEVHTSCTLTNSCNYHYVIFHKIMWFCVLNMIVHVCYFKKGSSIWIFEILIKYV